MFCLVTRFFAPQPHAHLPVFRDYRRGAQGIFTMRRPWLIMLVAMMGLVIVHSVHAEGKGKGNGKGNGNGGGTDPPPPHSPPPPHHPPPHPPPRPRPPPRPITRTIVTTIFPIIVPFTTTQTLVISSQTQMTVFVTTPPATAQPITTTMVTVITPTDGSTDLPLIQNSAVSVYSDWVGVLDMGLKMGLAVLMALVLVY